MKGPHKRTVLAVDDDEVNLMIIIKTVQEAGYMVKPFSSGQEAWDYMHDNVGTFDIVLLDKMMPGMSGLELLGHIKNHKQMRHLPVIIQTGDVGIEQMREGLENGAHYYLTKPFHPDILAAILHSAENECAIHEALMDELNNDHARFIGLLQEGDFTLKTHADARLFAATVSRLAVHPDLAVIGLMELLANAIEHGNFDIGHEKKCQCLWTHNWVQELTARAADAQYRERSVHIHVSRAAEGLNVTIRDEGKGFDWRRYAFGNGTTFRYNEPNGRGIAKAMVMLDNVQYSGKGNEVSCLISMPQKEVPLHRRGAGHAQGSRSNAN